MDRKHDLNYLQWLQQNARLYMIGLTVLTIFVILAISLFQQPWQQKPLAAWWSSDDDSNQVIAEQQEPTTQEKTDDTATIHAAEPIQPQTLQNSEGKELEQAIITQETQQQQEVGGSVLSAEAVPEDVHTTEETKASELQIQTLDLQQLATTLEGFVLPCNGTLLYGYGVGYDTIHDDYRFHDDICYHAAGAQAVACAAGTVQQMDLTAEWQLVLHCGPYQLRYKGLQECAAAVGDSVAGGEPLGTAGELLYVQAVLE